MNLPRITLADVEAAIVRKRRNKLAIMFPEDGPFSRHLYPKHMEFFADGANKRERLFRAANRVGKSEAGAYEVSLHLTGQYPEWWTGKRFKRGVNVLVAGETGRLVRDSIQEKLLGPPSDIGTGMLPFDTIIERRSKSGIPDAIDIVQVRHISGGVSQLQFQSFDQGREAFQATARDVVWMDEEPPLAVYSEALTRTMTTQGIVITTFTPLKGMSDTVMFLEEKFRDGKISLVTATWDDAPHLTEKDKEDLLSAYPPHQRDARTKGIPALGSGAIYPVSETDFIVDPFQLPPYWRRCYGMDVGWNRTAAIFGAYDDDNDVLYLYGEHYRGQAEPSVHADAIKAKGIWMPGVIDPASRGRGQKDGEQLLDIYQQLGLRVSVAYNGVESGIYEVYQRLSTGRIKVFSTLQSWLQEYRVYRRDDNGKVVKSNDHLMDATRYLVVSGIDVSAHPPEYKDFVTGNRTGGHTIHYDPLASSYIKQDIGATSSHQSHYDPLSLNYIRGK
ncbi:MAG: terminase family protein [Sterolibacterium sp.]